MVGMFRTLMVTRAAASSFTVIAPYTGRCRRSRRGEVRDGRPCIGGARTTSIVERRARDADIEEEFGVAHGVVVVSQ